MKFRQLLCFSTLLFGGANAEPEVGGRSLSEGIKVVRPSVGEDAWQKIGWRDGLLTAVDEAKKLHRPVLLWTMNGNPCGET